MNKAYEKNRRRWNDWGRRACRMGMDVDGIASTKNETINEWIREGYEKEVRKCARTIRRVSCAM